MSSDRRPPHGDAARRQDLILEGDVHPELEEIAALLEPEPGLADEASVRAHLVRCRRCFGIYAEMAHIDLAWRWDKSTDPVPAEWIEAVKGLGEPGTIRLPVKRATRPWLARPALAAAASIVVVAVGLFAYSRLRSPGVELAPVRLAVAEASRTGMILTAEIAAPGPGRRSGVAPSPALSRALNHLAVSYDEPSSSEETAYWLAAGMLAEGDRNAGVILSEATARFPRSLRLANLSAVAAYREDRVEEADRILAGILERQPRDPVALFNRATLLREQGLLDEAASLRLQLSEIDARSPLGMRVEAEFSATTRP